MLNIKQKILKFKSNHWVNTNKKNYNFFKLFKLVNMNFYANLHTTSFIEKRGYYAIALQQIKSKKRERKREGFENKHALRA